jgi:hypothetical protein
MTFRLNPELRLIPAFRLRNIHKPPNPVKPEKMATKTQGPKAKLMQKLIFVFW